MSNCAFIVVWLGLFQMKGTVQLSVVLVVYDILECLGETFKAARSAIQYQEYGAEGDCCLGAPRRLSSVYQPHVTCYSM